MKIQREYLYARATINQSIAQAQAERVSEHNEATQSEDLTRLEAGARVWIYLDRVKEGCARKLAHL